MTNKGRLFISTGFYLGLSPIAPGTCGALVGLIISIFLEQVETLSLQALILGLLVGLMYNLNKYLLPWAVDYWNEEDPKHFVFDEIGGYLVAYFIIGFKLCDSDIDVLPIRSLFYTFVFFRIFDILKVFPANVIENRFHNHIGVFFDDVVAGIYAALTMLLLWNFLI